MHILFSRMENKLLSYLFSGGDGGYVAKLKMLVIQVEEMARSVCLTQSVSKRTRVKEVMFVLLIKMQCCML